MAALILVFLGAIYPPLAIVFVIGWLVMYGLAICSYDWKEKPLLSVWYLICALMYAAFMLAILNTIIFGY